MGASASTPPPCGASALKYGSFKTTGFRLFSEGIVVLEPGEIEIGRSQELVFRISSKSEGAFAIAAKYLGGILQTLEFNHEDLISLLQDSEASDGYQKLVQKFDYKRAGNLLKMGRAFSFDVTKLLPFLYECFAKQELAEKGERLVQQKQLERLKSSPSNPKPTKTANAATAPKATDSTINEHVKELEAIEQQLRSKSLSTSPKKKSSRNGK
eukprot:m.99841 g.99841  ORF g.99841 m.99841 type:complete len:212 (+) comp27195_c0_seq1:311-946(+)